MPTKSVRLDIRMDPDLKSRAQAAAETNYQTLTDWVIQLMRQEIQRQESKSRAAWDISLSQNSNSSILGIK